MRLTDEELRDVLARAEEIQTASIQGQEMRAEIAAVIAAAEEVGLSRPAVERALRERLDLPTNLPAPGSLAFATSVDGKAYVAEVLSISPESARVRFLRGIEHEVTPDQLRPCSLVPGARMVCMWPWWGPWTCTLVRYDATSQAVVLGDGWGSEHTCSLADVWLAAPRSTGGARGARRRGVLLLGVGAGLGALVASVATALLLR